MNRIYPLSSPILTLVTIILLYSCEDPVDIDTGFDSPQLVVDAWLDNRPDVDQYVHLSWSQDYFDNHLPKGIKNAEVTISTPTETYSCTHSNNGYYLVQHTDASFGQVGTIYTLTIILDDKEYTATTYMAPSPPIDSINIKEASGPFSEEGDLHAQMYARDFAGIGNAYWIKSYRNDTLLMRPLEMNLAFDAGLEPGSDLDGTTFIHPIRFGVNALDKNGAPRALHSGDKIKTEIYSITPLAFQFLQIVKMQLSNGDNGIFSLPVSNAIGNVKDKNGNHALGMFSVSDVTALEKIIE